MKLMSLFDGSGGFPLVASLCGIEPVYASEVEPYPIAVTKSRLQGFPDLWGHLNKKESFTDEEYKFWIEVRNAYAKINNKAVKDYTKAQILTWYNKLHSDSSEYKMWGNGIALPNALYVMQGIAEVVGVHHSK